MTTQQLNDEFTRLYSTLEDYARKALSYFRSPVDLSAVLSECYLHVRRFETEIQNSSQLEAYCKHWIKQNLRWKTSPLSKPYYSTHQELQDVYRDTTFQFEEFLLRRNTEFLQTLSPYQQRLWSIYFEKHKVSGRLIAEHLKMSLSTGYVVLRECKEISQKYREFLLKYI